MSGIRIPMRTVQIGDQWPQVVSSGQTRLTVVSVGAFKGTSKRHRGWIEVVYDNGTRRRDHGATHVNMWRESEQ